MSRSLVTGGCGFIGSHLCERLLELGHEVICVDDLSTGRYSNIAHLIKNESFKLQAFDIKNLGPMNFVGVDWVFHLAAKADIVPSIEKPKLYHDVNVNGTLHVLECAKAAGVKRFLYAASSSCYGDRIRSETYETSPCDPRYPYALTKYVGEQYVLHWGRLYGMSVNSLRLFNVYGPRHRTAGSYGAVIGVFLTQLLNGSPLTVVGDGKQSRDFTYVTDVAKAFTAVASNDEVNGEIFNVGAGVPQTINRLVDILRAKYKPDLRVVEIPDRPGEPRVTHAGIDKIRKLVGWHPMISFQVGVPMLLEKIEDFRNAPLWTKKSIEQATAKWFQYMK